MKKNICCFFLITFFSFLFYSNVSAASYGVVNTAVLRVRAGASTGTTQLAQLTVGNIVDLVSSDKTPDGGGCEGQGWYQIYYGGGKTGYVCSLYLDVYEKNNNVDNKNPSTSCENDLANKGFPSSYWSGLCALKSKHANWNFESLKTGVDFGAAVTAETSCGKSLMNTSNGNYINYDCARVDYNGYKTVSSGVVAYYLDPRNFFNDTHIFMYESQYYNNNISDNSYVSTTSKIYNNNFMISNIPSLPHYILNAGKSTGMSPVAITSRMYQELGNGKLTSGTYAGQLYSAVSGNYTSRYPSKVADDGHSLNNYYNFYNINAYDSSGDITLGALKYAYKQGWGGTGNQDVDRGKAITGGAGWIKARYLDAGQQTAYLQKFNVNPNIKTSLYTNQYMTNIEAPKSEGSIIYKAYSNLNMLDSAFTFYIPVFEQMPTSTSLPTNGSDKNYGGNNTSNNNPLNPSTPSPDPSPQVPSVNSIIAGAKLSTSENYITGINPKTSVQTIKASLESMGGKVTIQNGNGQTVTTGNIGTGFKITINGSVYYAVIYGDPSGDGKINALDLLKVQKHILKTPTLSGAQFKAADVSKDGKINALDLLKIQKYILGKGSIVQ